jgi:hypothetical protein
VRLLRSEWQTPPHLSAPQFLARGFAERKLLLVVEVIRQCIRLHDEGQRALDATRTVLPYTRRVGSCEKPEITCLDCHGISAGVYTVSGTPVRDRTEAALAVPYIAIACVVASTLCD